MAKDIVKALDPIFKPRSIAFIGASNNPLKWGFRVLDRAKQSSFPGYLYPVNRNEASVQGLPAYPSLAAIPGDVDLAVIMVPAAQVPQVFRECREKGVKGAIVITAGFAEIGPEGARLQQEIVKIAHEGGIRFVGPNCMGIWSAVGRVNLCFEDGLEPGGIAFISQSGTFGGYLAQVAGAKGYGLSKFVSAGNQASLSFADYLEYLAQDEDTKAIVLYIEGITEGRRFFEVAREVVRDKPIILYKAGRTLSGSKAALSHTGSLTGKDEVFDALCRQVGILRGYEALHPFDMAEALVSQPLPRGNRVAIISGGGGQCVTTADACAALGLELPEIDPEAQERLKEHLEAFAPAPKNPIDTAAAATPSTIAKLVEIVAGLDYIDGIITNAPMGGGRPIAYAPFAKALINAADALIRISQTYQKPIITCRMRSTRDEIHLAILRAGGVPAYETPEECARAMAALVNYAQIRRWKNEIEESPRRHDG